MKTGFAAGFTATAGWWLAVAVVHAVRDYDAKQWLRRGMHFGMHHVAP